LSERLEYLAAQLAIFTDELGVVRRIAHSKAAMAGEWASLSVAAELGLNRSTAGAYLEDVFPRPLG
jgi:hypothetical protein